MTPVFDSYSSGDEVVIDVDPVVLSHRESCKERCNCGCFYGRFIKDWSQYIMGGAGCAGGGGVLVGYLMSDPRVILGSVAVLALDLLFGCSRISCLKPKKEIEEQLEDAKAEIIKLIAQTEVLRGTKDELKEAFLEANSTVQDLKKSLQESVDGLSTTERKYQDALKKLKIVENLFDQFKLETRRLAKDVNLYARTAKVFENHIGNASSEVEKLKIKKKELAKKIDDFGDAEEYQKEQNDVLKHMLTGLQGNIDFMRDKFRAMSEEVAELRKHTNKLDEVDDKFREGTENLDDVASRLMSNADRLREELQQFNEDSDSFSGYISDDEESPKTPMSDKA